jgi:hypothetical protein
VTPIDVTSVGGSGRRRLAYYSVSLPSTEIQPLLWQLEASVRSLRKFNTTLPVVVFVYGPWSPEVSRRLDGLGVRVVHQGSYERRLASLLPHGSHVLAEYPILHKFLNLAELKPLDLDQVLVLDCDTIFFGDVERLFEHLSADCYAREEPYSRRSHYGHDASYLDEDLLEDICAREGFVPPAPFNCGVVLLSRRATEMLATLGQRLVDYAWRLMVWMAAHPLSSIDGRKYGEGRGVQRLRWSYTTITSRYDRQRALAFPSANRWILEEVALWLTIGSTRSLSCADFPVTDVLQDGELWTERRQSVSCVVCHYYSRNLAQLEPIIERLVGPMNTVKEVRGRYNRLRTSINSIRIPDALVDSPVIREDRGFRVYEHLLSDNEFSRLRREAIAYYPEAGHDVYFGPPRGVDRTANPVRQFAHVNGGPVQQTIFGSESLLNFLTSECDLTVRTDKESGTYSYYVREGDFIGLHLDREACDLVLITILNDNSSLAELDGALVVYPEEIATPLTRLQERGSPDAIPLKPRVGQSVLLFGGVVPHFIAPVRLGQDRVIAVSCYQVVV